MERMAIARGISFLPHHLQIVENAKTEIGLDGWSRVVQYILVDWKRLKNENQLLRQLLKKEDTIETELEQSKALQNKA